MNFRAYKIIQCIGHLHAALKCLHDVGPDCFPVMQDKLKRDIDRMECNRDFDESVDGVPEESKVEY